MVAKSVIPKDKPPLVNGAGWLLWDLVVVMVVLP
jgi:hypothetical protein